MFERLLISFAITLLGVLAFILFQMWQKRQILAEQFGQATLLYFRADSCPTCPTQGRYISALEAKANGRFAIRTIDADQDAASAARYRVMTLPTTIVLDPQGAVKHINYGLTPTGKLAQQLETVV